MNDASDSRTSLTLLGRLRDLTDATAWREFVRRYAPRIYGWCRRRTLQDADAQNATQDVLVKLARALQTFEYDAQKGGFRAWLRTVTRNACADLSLSGEQNGSGDPRVQEQLNNVAARNELADALDQELQRELLEEAMARVRLRVDAQTWEIFHLLAFTKQSGATVAVRFGRSLDAVYKARSRVKEMLKEEVQALEARAGK